MKSYFLFVLTVYLFLTNDVSGQPKFGFHVGIGQSKIGTKSTEPMQEQEFSNGFGHTGFLIGASCMFPLKESLLLRTQFGYINRGGDVAMDNTSTDYTGFSFNYLDMSVMLERLIKNDFYLKGGISVNYLLRSIQFWDKNLGHRTDDLYDKIDPGIKLGVAYQYRYILFDLNFFTSVLPIRRVMGRFGSTVQSTKMRNKSFEISIGYLIDHKK